jgi:D-3-phosphoglycerate dehydrogenase/C-terminal binding protein
MTRLKVVITDFLTPPAVFEERVLSDLADVVCLQLQGAPESCGDLVDADGMIVFHEVSLNATVISSMKRCRVIVRCGVGFDNVDGAAAGAKGIRVCNVPDYGVDEVADHAIGLMLACNRGLCITEKQLRHTMTPWCHEAGVKAQRLAGGTFGVIGLGRIGTAAAMRAKAFRMNVVAYDPYIPDGRDKALGVTMVSLEELMSTSDVISVHTPLTEETRGIVSREMIAAMKPYAILVNTARGPCVDVDSAAAALRAGRIGGLGLDVLPIEPPVADTPIVQLWQQDDPPMNVVLTPHNAFYSEQGFEEMRTKAAAEVKRVLTGTEPRNCVNRDCLT